MKLKITGVENENISFMLNVSDYELRQSARDEAQEITLEGNISDFQGDVEPLDVDREDIKKLSRKQLESLLVKWMINANNVYISGNDEKEKQYKNDKSYTE